MNIIAAIKSGRPFRRKEYANTMDYIRLPEKGFNVLNLAIGDILADDWEIEEAKVEITESAYEAACDAAISYGCHEFKRRLKLELFGKGAGEK